MMRRILLLLLFIGCLPNLSKAQTESYGAPFSFTLPIKATTSAGVYAKDGTLIRTLWNNIEYNAGTYKKEWDGKDDDGNLASNSNYKIVVQTNNVKYEWEGAWIGNTSKDMLGGKKHRAFSTVAGMAINGNYAYYCTGFNEGTSSLYKFALDDKQVIKRVLDMSGHQIAATDVTTDGKLVYWAGYDAWSSGTMPAFVVATRVSDDTENKFATGVSVTMSKGRTYNSAIDVDRVSKISGIAVMRNSNYLFVSHNTANEVRVFDKTTGKLLQTLPYTSPGAVLVDRSDKYLWIINGNETVKKLPINKDGTLGKPILTINGVINPLAFDISPDNSTIVITDGNNGDEKVKAFSANSGGILWTMGRENYEENPNVRNDKFYFINRNTSLGPFKTFACFEPNGSFWIGDTGNYRMQHYSKDQKFIDRIMYLPHSYNVSADVNNPTKVFDEYLEFKIDYSKPLQSNNGSWELVRNYRAVLKNAFYGKDEMRTIFKSVVTLSNGRTYATVQKRNKYNVVELPEDAPMRFTGIAFGEERSVLIVKDGSLRSYENRNAPNLASFYKQDLKGFDANNNPIWSQKNALSELPVVRTDPHDFAQNRNGQSTNSGLLISFNKNAYEKDTGYHLGAIKIGDDKWLWKTSKSTSKTYKGDFPKDGTFDIGNGVTSHSGGAGVFVVDDQIFWNYNGEFWKNAQTNYWNHFTDNGLMVAQFGTWRDEIGNLSIGAAKMAGNAFSGQMVKVGENIYIYQNDESQHSGIHRWKISGLNTIKQIDVNVKLASSGQGLLGTYYSGINLDNTNIKTTRIDTNVNFNWTKEKPAGTDLTSNENLSVTWSGFVTPLFSQLYTFYTNGDDGVMLWVDGKLLINSWKDKIISTEINGSIQLVAGKHYSILLQYYQKKGNSSIALLWKSASQKKQVIPTSQLQPSIIEDQSRGIDLMEHLSMNGILKNGMFGWGRNPVSEDSTAKYSKWWGVKTGTKNFKTPDVSVVFRQPNNTAYYVTRNLGSVNDNIGEWNISGNISYEDNYANTTGGGHYLEVLDDQGKIMTRIYNYEDTQLSVYLNTNKNIIARGSSKDLNPIIKSYQAINIKGSSAGITVKYGPYAPVTAPVLDPKSNWKKPTTLRIYFYTVNRNAVRVVSLQGFRFKTSMKNTTGSLNKANQSINFPAIGTRKYKETMNLSATASSNLPVRFILKSGPATLFGNTITFNEIGEVVIEAFQPGDGEYAAATSVTQTFNVTKYDQTISFSTISEKRSGDPAFIITATASSNLPVKFKITYGGATLATNKITLTGGGRVTVEASQTGNDKYSPAPTVSQTFMIVKNSQSITFNDIPDKNPNDPAFNIITKASSGLPVRLKIMYGPAKISGSKVTLTGVGKVAIEASQPGDAKYFPALSVSKIFSSAKTVQTINFAAISNRKYRDPAFNLVATASSGMAVSFKLKSGPAKLSGSKVTLTGIGKVVIEASQAGNAKYGSAPVIARTFEVEKLTQTINFADIPDKKPGDSGFSLVASVSSGLPLSYKVKSGPAKLSGSRVTLTGTGTVVIEAQQAGDKLYSAAVSVRKTFNVGDNPRAAQPALVQSKSDQTIDFPNVLNGTASQTTFSLVATASSGLPVSFKLKSGPATLSGKSLTVTGLGGIVIEASQSGNDKYNAAVSVSRSFSASANPTTTIIKQNQSISFPLMGQRIVGSSFLIPATASSGLPVSFRVKSGPATISGSKITLKSTGTVIVEAYQSGNEMYKASANVSQTILVVNTDGAIMSTSFNTENIKNPEVAMDKDYDKEEVAIKTDFKIYPNPATISTTVEYILEQGSNVILELFNSQSILINRIILGNQEAKSTHEYKMDTANLPMGIYIIRLLSAEAVISKRLVIVNK